MAISITDHELPYETHNTYSVNVFGDSIFTTVTHDAATVSEWISETESINSRIVGLDVEWRPSYSRIQNPIATLQLCVDHRCLIFQLIHASSIPPSLVSFLSNPNYTFVGVGIGSDIEKLQEDYEFGFHTNTADLRDLAADFYKRIELKNKGLKDLAMVVLDKEVNKPKRVTMSRWDYQWLNYDQVQYACVDAFLSFEMGKFFMNSS